MNSTIRILFIWILTLIFFGLTGCNTSSSDTLNIDIQQAESGVLTLPALEALPLNGEPLKVVATTSIIGDVVAQVGGDVIALTTLIESGIDPHSYQPGAQDWIAVENAQVIFVNGWDLEEALAKDLAKIGSKAVIVPISAGISPLAFDKSHEKDHEEEAFEGDEHSGADPHVWFNIQNVEQWVKNVETVLRGLDPVNTKFYAGQATTYLAQLEEFDEYVRARLTEIPSEKRVLVTNHDTFGYFAEAYGFEVLGTVIPGSSTLAEPSAGDLTTLIETMETRYLCTLFTEMTVSDALAKTIAVELIGCKEVKILPLYTGALGPKGSGAESYLAMFRTNVDTIVEGLR